ncbi:glycosyltransferase family 4 protein [Seonamhaeicola sp. ML3]|uniref:glycosyltransferase family 4 protein n=1 Tax=Seonamhaeicola sp. ML3 TaxID=2937786 RepID=UPI00200C3AC4|nr:glycosyltransferase family 4 protein [Seonamhaeicola sp. ML3]
MSFLIITHVVHKKTGNDFYGYAPYVREMNLWFKHVDNVTVVAPLCNEEFSNIDIAYAHKNLTFVKIPEIAFISLKKVLNSILKLPLIFLKIFQACRKADHIHLRCPGNIGLIGCFVQMLFPSKIKTAKYAGNWDPNSKQPLSYKIQKRILSNTFLTKNIHVLVYGSWENQTKNIKSFFTATYFKNEIEPIKKRDYSNNLKFVFMGSLVEGKRPLLTIKIIELLKRDVENVTLDFYGDGVLKKQLQDYIADNQLDEFITIHGNKQKREIKEALKQAHFLILPSKSEGWPKVIAEAMFFGVIPISTRVSCVPFMLNEGKRGILIEPNKDMAVKRIINYLNRGNDLSEISVLAAQWSQNYTLDVFESEIKKLLN